MMANKEGVKSLIGSSKLNGIMLYDEDVTPSNWSAGDQSPDNTTHMWNADGGGFGSSNAIGMHWIDIGVPMFLLNKEDAAYVNAQYANSKQFGAPNDVVPNMFSARLKFFMWAAGTAEMCLRRTHSGFPFCQPLGGHSVVGSLIPGETSKDVTVVAAQLDAVSLFHDNSYGASSSAASIAGIVQ